MSSIETLDRRSHLSGVTPDEFGNEINVSDIAIFAARFNQPATFNQGDFNSSGNVDLPDVALLASVFNVARAASADRIPENPRVADYPPTVARSAVAEGLLIVVAEVPEIF